MMDFGKQGWTPDRLGDLSGKTYVITGASSGTGLCAAKRLAGQGAKVVMMNRNAGKTQALIADIKRELGDQLDLDFVQLDLAVLASVRKAAAELLALCPRIDALICNAAIAQVATQEITVDGFESQLGVNHFAHFLLCGLLFNRIEASQGRIVVMGSNGYRMGLKRIKFEDLNFDEDYGPWNAYAQSKLAQLMFVYELQRRVKAKGQFTQIFGCHPGAARTSLIENDKVKLWMKFVFKLMSPFAQSADKGAWPMLMCATEEGLEPLAYYGPTRMEMTGPVGKCDLQGMATDEESATKLWDLSLKAVAKDGEELF